MNDVQDLKRPQAPSEPAALLRSYSCSAAMFAGAPDALYERHLKFDNIVDPPAADGRERYEAAARAVRDILSDRWLRTDQTYQRENPKRVYYVSIEFLIGRSLSNNIQNLMLDPVVGKAFDEQGRQWMELLDKEPDAGLGNGGLGRLAACFLDSLATMDMPGYAYGINYEFGIFRQQIRDGYQVEQPDSWQRETSPWLVARPEESCQIPVYGRIEYRADRRGEYRQTWVDRRVLTGIPSDLPIAGFGGKTVNFVRLYSAAASNEFDMQIFNAGDYMKAVEQKMVSETISKVLYPSDAVAAGRELRLLQEYFFVACAIRDIVFNYLRRGEEFDDFPDKVAIQLNDTHPALTIAELMRLFVDEHEIPWEKAWDLTRATVAYTNHTLMPEALERWPAALLERVVPRHLQIIYEINRRFMDKAAAVWSNDPESLRRVSIIEEGSERQVRMAHLAVVGSHSINGVSKLHSELLKTRLVPEFYHLWPERFSNKTNGVTQRRWLLQANPGLSKLLDWAIGEGWVTDLERLIGVEQFADDEGFQAKLRITKIENKERLARIVNRLANVDVDPASIFDVQAKRIHEYKRQLLMALGIVHQYLAIVEDGVEPPVPRVYIMAGKAAPGYWVAKMIVKLINSLGDVINNDTRTRGLIKVAFLPDYRVSLAEKIIPAADVSEQISTAGTEASGTGNMKFAMNGALTIGTLDGANVEIREAVGAENIFIFGLTAGQIEEHNAKGTYRPREVYDSDPRLRRVLDALSSDRFCPNEPDLFRWIRDVLLESDKYFLLADFGAYVDTQTLISTLYTNEREWNRKSVLNVARIGRFSSDRTVREYAREIWGLDHSRR